MTQREREIEKMFTILSIRYMPITIYLPKSNYYVVMTKKSMYMHCTHIHSNDNDYSATFRVDPENEFDGLLMMHALSQNNVKSYINMICKEHGAFWHLHQGYYKMNNNSEYFFRVSVYFDAAYYILSLKVIFFCSMNMYLINSLLLQLPHCNS